MNKITKNGTLSSLKISFLSRKYQKPSNFASSELTDCPCARASYLLQNKSNYGDKRITGQACLADDW